MTRKLFKRIIAGGVLIICICTYGEISYAEETGSLPIPEGVIQEVYKTLPEESNIEEEASGASSFPDESELRIYPEDVISMVMPVISDSMYDFVLDPSDLLSRYSVNKEEYRKSSIYFTNHDKEIISHSGISDPAMAINKSSVPVFLRASIQIENEDGWPVSYSSIEGAMEGSGNTIAFSLIPVVFNRESGEQMLYPELQAETDEKGYAEISLLIDGSEDNFDRIGDRYVAKEEADWSSVGFAVSGVCNTNADWGEIDKRSAAGEKLRIRVTYGMGVIKDEEEQSFIDLNQFNN